MNRSKLFRASPLALLLAGAVGCASGTDDGTPLEDGGDETPVEDAGQTPRDAGRDSGATDAGVDAGPPPAVRVDLFADANFAGESTFARIGVTNDLGAFADRTSSARVAVGYVAYGFSDTNLGGTISEVVTSEVASLPVGQDDTWSSVTVRDADEPYVTLYTIIGGGARRYPYGSFPSMGANNDTVDGFSIPTGVTIEAFRDVDFEGPIGTYVGPLDTSVLPESNTWSSLRIRASVPADEQTRATVLYVNPAYAGANVVLSAPGRYPSLAFTSNNFTNVASSARSSTGFAVYGFSYGNYGGRAFGPLTTDTSSIPGNDDWDSVILVPAGSPTVTLYMDSGYAAPNVRPVVDVSNLWELNDDVDGITVPTGYVVYGFSDVNYGGSVYTHNAGQSATSHDNWTSYRIVPEGTATATFYRDAGRGNPQVYPLGSYTMLYGNADAFDGAVVPAGLRVCAYDGNNYSGTRWELVGPVDAPDLGANGKNAWASMVITTGSCP